MLADQEDRAPGKMTSFIFGLGPDQILRYLDTLDKIADNALTINIGAEGQIKDLTKITPTSINVVPEPKPQALPIKNGKTVSVEFSVPLISMTKVYTGTITATGSPSGGSMLGGGVGVATQVEIMVVPPKSALSPINPTYLLIAVAVLAMIIIIVMLKRSGFRIKIEKKSRK